MSITEQLLQDIKDIIHPRKIYTFLYGWKNNSDKYTKSELQLAATASDFKLGRKLFRKVLEEDPELSKHPHIQKELIDFADKKFSYDLSDGVDYMKHSTQNIDYSITVQFYCSYLDKLISDEDYDILEEEFTDLETDLI